MGIIQLSGRGLGCIPWRAQVRILLIPLGLIIKNIGEKKYENLFNE